jgi:hypothetical protein
VAFDDVLAANEEYASEFALGGLTRRLGIIGVPIETVYGLALAAGEAIEDPALELLRDAWARVLDGDAEVTVALLRLDPDRRGAVPRRVRQQVRDDAVEHEGPRPPPGRDVQLDPAAEGKAPSTTSASTAFSTTGRGSTRIACVETREVEQLLDQPP